MPTTLLQKLFSPSNSTTDRSLLLSLKQQAYLIHSNSHTLLEELSDYFGKLASWHTKESSLTPTTVEITVLQTEQNQAFIDAIEWQDWAREAGKTGRKDAFYDLDYNGRTLRLLYKVKTGMIFTQPNSKDSQTPLMALGPVEQHPNQIINYILTQYLNHHLRHGWSLGHAAGLVIHQKGVTIAGLSGGGKSTLMLHLLEHGEHFISNDRLLFKANTHGDMLMRGIPKQPRINPGTIVHNPRLHNLITEKERQAFLAMPQEELRALEMKFDAQVDQVFWPDCYRTEAKLDYIIILNWKVQTEEATALRITNMSESPNLVPALLKSEGPFFNNAQGEFLANGSEPDALALQNLLGKVPVLELHGKVDFTKAEKLVMEALSDDS